MIPRSRSNAAAVGFANAEIQRVFEVGGRCRMTNIVPEALPGWVRRSESPAVSWVAGAVSECGCMAGLPEAGPRKILRNLGGHRASVLERSLSPRG